MSSQEAKIKMISSASEVVRMKSRNKSLSHEELLQHVSNKALAESSNETKVAMIAAASKALDYKERNPASSEKEIINHIMDSINDILQGIDIRNS